MPAGYSGTPLVKKLGLREGFKVLLVNEPENYFDLLAIIPEKVRFLRSSKTPVDFIHFFVKDSAELKKQLPVLKKKLAKTGMLWVSWPKKSSKIPSTVNDGFVRKSGLETGLVDIKVCAVDEIWSGLKFVYRTRDR
jgi:hypothetical protein